MSILMLYYMCDAIVVHRPLSLSPPELAECIGYYEAVKAEFSEGPLQPPGKAEAEAQRRAAYAAFKAWEADNETLVATMRAQARARVLRKS